MDKNTELRAARKWRFGYESRPGYWLWSDPVDSLAELSDKYAKWIDSHPDVKVLIHSTGTMVPAE
jgi:hypothetical protein